MADGGTSSRRLLVGLQVAGGGRRVAGVLVAASGRGLDARFELIRSADEPTAPEVAERFARLRQQGMTLPGEAAALAGELAEVEACVVQRLLDDAHRSADDVLAMAVHDPGLWHIPRGKTREESSGETSYFLSLCDSARLAETTRLNVIDAFPARDLAAGGQGGPVIAFPHWILLHDPDCTTVVLDLGGTTRLSYLPGPSGAEHVLSFDVGPGMLLLDRLASQFSHGTYAFDPGGRLAVQGRKIPELIDHWLADPYFHKPPPRWYPLGLRPDEELQQSFQMAVDAGWSLRDLLCTATHFIAECVQQAFAEHLPSNPPIDQLLITGGGRQNGMLLGEITARLSHLPLTITTELGLSGGELDASCAAVLGLLHIDRVPASAPAITGCPAPRVLGRLTPGSPEAWQRLLSQMQVSASDMA